MFESQLGFSARLPQKQSNALTLITPFTMKVWLFLMVSAVVMEKTLSTINIWHKRQIIRTSILSGESLLIMASLITKESLHEKSFSARFMISGYSFLFVCLPMTTILSVAYESTLLSNLVSPIYETPLDTFQQLLDSGKEFHMPANTFTTSEAMATSPIESIRKMYNLTVSWPLGYHGEERENMFFVCRLRMNGFLTILLELPNHCLTNQHKEKQPYSPLTMLCMDIPTQTA